MEGDDGGPLGDDTTGTGYTRGGYLKEIRYGQRAGALFSGSPAASDKVTETTYDSLGRTTQVWLPNRLRVLDAKPNHVYGYHVTGNGMSWVSAAATKGDGSGHNTTYEFYDSLLRPRQVQEPEPGRRQADRADPVRLPWPGRGHTQ